MNDKLKIAMLSSVTSVIVAGISTGVVSATTQNTPQPDRYAQERALILDALQQNRVMLRQIDDRIRRLEMRQVRFEVLLRGR